MKKTIILSLCALVALACAKETAPVSAEFGQAITVPAEIEATIDATKLGLDNSLNLFWQPGDEILLRMSGATWTEANNCNIFTAVQEGDKLTFKGELQYVAGKNGFLYAAASNRSIFPVLSSSSQFNYNWYSNQSGLLEDLGKYSVLWAKTDGTKPYGIVKDGDIYKISANFTPFFCLLKFNVAEGLGVAKIVIKANNTLGGEVTIVCSRATSTGFGPATQFALYGSSATYPQFNEITINRDGDEITGDVYVSICPNDYADGDFINAASEYTFTFYDEDDEKLGDFTRTLTTPLRNAQIKNLGNVTTFEKKPVTDFKPVIVAKRSSEDKSFAPQFIASADESLTGAKYYYEMGSSLGAVATPTTASAEIPETGIPVDVTVAYDIQYVKVLATCPGHDDVYIQAAIRNWKFGEGFTVASGNGLEFPDTFEAANELYLKTPTLNGLSKTDMTASTILGGKVSFVLKAHNATGKKNFNLFLGDQMVYSLVCTSNLYTSSDPAFVMTNGVSAAAGTTCKIQLEIPDSNGRVFYIWDYAIIEQDTFTPAAAPQASATINGLTNASQYNF